MAGKRDEPHGPERRLADAQPDQGTDGGEHTGALRIERLRKADGRALILYSAAPERE